MKIDHSNIRMRVLTIMLIVSALFTVLSFVPQEADAAHQATIKLTNPTQEADVSPGKPGVVTFDGQVEISSFGPQTNVQVVIVSLQAEAGGFPVAISPSTISFQPQQTTPKSFRVSVTIPQRTSSQTNYQIQVSGQITTLPGMLITNVPATQGTITIDQFYKFSASTTKPYYEVDPGDQLVFSIKIQNEGNGFDTFEFDIENEDKLKGWVFGLSQRQIEIGEQQEDTIKLTINTPQEWDLWVNEVDTIRFKIQSKQAEFDKQIILEQQLPLYVRQKGFYVPAFDPILIVFALAGVVLVLKIQTDRFRNRRK